MLFHRLLQSPIPGKTLSSIRPRLHRHLTLPTQLSLRTPQRTMSSAASAIHTDLEGMPSLDKWGWVIYRTTYGNDDAWARFRARVERESRASISRSDAPEIADKLEWTWVEDAAALDGIPRGALRERFRAWVGAEKERMLTARRAEGQEALEFDPAAVPRYAFFVQVDEEALRSVTGEKEWDARGAHVKFVDAGWRPLAEAFPDMDENEEDESYEEIDECREENVGWMQISPYMLNADFYDVWCGVVDIWHAFYKRPPKTVNW
ncbi:hypothetical protein QBC32DRAFT_356491 [Pseudoneurospora amorphoporcata]|uniref:Uncharacterized protein n=1 Tax=Pseudoneurospora amorphoporcata TaxID=241081 RepID=A0AAN6NKK1_9PEZI|nr:hypothetical protein QBC32DRAFT_356491 [Pseudoneurospora amorphoporcata]